jgi:GH15 family glucan-1,4-alpha-glucosidase
MKIEDYALIGDSQTAALVGRDCSIDWLCFPRFDSGACFAALLGDESHGRWILAPAGKVKRSTRRYRTDTLVLETELETEDGTVRVLDFMPPRGRYPDVVRIVEGVSGRVPMRMQLVIRFDYGSIVPWVRQHRGALTAIGGPDALVLRTHVPTRGEDFTTIADFEVDTGDLVPFALTWHPSNEPLPEAIDPVQALTDTIEYWTEWNGRSRYNGDWPEAVQTSLMVLKALTYAPTGGIVAAPTTSLPEQLGGVRNWDYRYCWLRDATFSLYALMLAGYRDEAIAWRDWLLRAVAGDPSELKIMYGPAGERRLPELELDWLPGYERSSPVRIGNAASLQRQLDVYGEVADSLWFARRIGIPADEPAWQLTQKLLEFLEGAWNEPDEGIWEIRGDPQQFTYSKVMVWVAFDRAVKTIEGGNREGDVDRWRRLRDEVRREVLEKGYDADRGSFVQRFGAKDLDASALMLPFVGFLPATDERMVGTVEAIQRELTRDGFVLRYSTEAADAVDGLPPGEAAFLPCSFWLADNLALLGRRSEARALFERLVGLGNDLGLLSEEYDPASKRLVGNFPQAFTHVALVNSAYNLAPGFSPSRHRADGTSKDGTSKDAAPRTQ